METDAKHKVRVQKTLDELFNERLLPFELTAYHMKAEGAGEYVVLFYDSRIPSIKFSSKDEGRLKEVVRAAVLDRVDKMSRPLKAGLCINRNRAERSIGMFPVGKESGEVTSGLALALSGSPF